MSDYFFSSLIRFCLLITTIGAMGALMLFRLCQNCTMSPQEVKRRLGTRDMVEMQDMMNERVYEGRIFLPVGC